MQPHPAGRLGGGILFVRISALMVSVALVGALGIVKAQGPVPGANVNVISGNGPDGDWTMQRQNEPSMSCSSRNPRHCLAGANDYRAVDIPFPPDANRVTGDAWLGWYTTRDGGLTWRTRLLPGFPQDTSAAGQASPLRGYAAGADPVIRPGTNGLFYYTGIVFNREAAGASAVFVSRFIDNNNQEGNAGEPIAYIGTTIVDSNGVTTLARTDPRAPQGRAAAAAAQRTAPPRGRGRGTTAPVVAGAAQEPTNEVLIDKPWMAVDVPRTGAQTCSIGGGATGIPAQSFPGGRVYLVYTIFDGSGATQRGRVMFSRSLDCGQTWSAPRLISRVKSADVNDDGVANNADVSAVYASLNRTCGQDRFNASADVNNDCKVNSLDLGYVNQNVNRPVPPQPRLSQGATLAIHPQTGALQFAWRQFRDGVSPDAIVAVRSNDAGGTFTSPQVVSLVNRFDQGSTDTSFRTNGFPTLAMDGTGRSYLAWSTRGLGTAQPDATNGDARVVISTSTAGTAWSQPRPIDNVPPVGHQLMPALTFAQGKLQLIYYDLREDLSGLFGPYVDELPILNGPSPRIRHTMELRGAQASPGDAPVFTSFRLTQYQFGSAPGSQTVQQLQFNPPNLPLFRAGTTPFMGDYIDTAPAVPFVRNGSSWSFNTAASSSPVFHAIWTDNRDVRPPADGNWTNYTAPNPPFARPAMSGVDPTVALPACVPGQAGMRNQNIYTARISEGLAVGALATAKTLGSIQRSFPVFAQNNSAVIRSYRLTILNQPPGGQASFRQFAALPALDVQVPPRSTVARTVFATSSDPHAQINVSVVEIAAPGGAAVANGQQGTIVLNPDPTNPDIENPDIENPDIENPDIENPDIENPDIENQEVYNPDIENAAVRNPDIENPDIENPDIENPDIENARVANPNILNPDIENPDIENPDIENPDIENPDIENADLTNGALSDTTWVVSNKGNAAAAFTVRLSLAQGLPAGFRSQLIAHKQYQTPTVVGCSLRKQPQTVLIANIPNPRFVSASELANPDIENPDIENLTIGLGPGETARITLRVLDPNRFDAVTFSAAQAVAPAIVAQSVNTVEAQQGITQPAAAGVLTSNAPLPGATAGGAYSTTLGSTGSGTWTIVGGQLPAGTSLNGATGVISGTPTESGTFVVTLRFQSTTGLIDYRTITIVVGDTPAAAADLAITAAPAGPVAVGSPLAYALTVRNFGPATSTNVVVSDTLPPGAVFVSATPSQGTCTHANGRVVCNLGSLAATASATVGIIVRPTGAGALVNRATVTGTGADPVVTNNSVDTTASATSFTPCSTVCFSGPARYPAGTVDSAFDLQKADFNEDGRLDVAFSAYSENAIAVLFGDGAGGFGPPTVLTTAGMPTRLAVGDFNNDSHADIFTGHSNLEQASLFLGNGAGGFAAPITVATGVYVSSLATADFNRDGNADVVLTDSRTTLNLLFGNGNGTFQAPVLDGETSFGNVIVEDFNNDDIPDLAFTFANPGGVVILRGDGAGNFPIAGPSIAAGTNAAVRQVGDLNGDGAADLVVTDTVNGAGRLRVLFGNGAGGFPTVTTLPLDPQATFTSAADMDGDGNLDLVSSRNGVTVHLNDGNGGFGTPLMFAAAGSLHVVGDFNGDLRPDVVQAGGSPAGLHVLLNTCSQPPAELALAASGPAGPVAEGSSLTYTATVTNNGPNAAAGVVLTSVVDSSLGTVTGTASSQGTCTESRGLITCTLATIAPGAAVSVTSTVRAAAGGTLTNIIGVTAAASNPNPANNYQLLSTTVTPGASTFVVTNTNDTGPGSFRQALTQANADGGQADTITFDIPGGGVHTIRPGVLLGLPAIVQPVIIDGTTQPGYAGTPLIAISGEDAGLTGGLVISGGGTTVRGLAIGGFQHAGIRAYGGTGNVFEANFLGLTPAGVPNPNAEGIRLDSGGHRVGGLTTGARNVISANIGAGVVLAGSGTANHIAANYIGTGADGASPLGNGSHGVLIEGSGHLVGNLDITAGNTIAFNGGAGVFIQTGTGNAVGANSIHSNSSLGIDLAPAGVTPNDAGDEDTGANTLLNAPVLASATVGGGVVTISGTLSPSPAAPYFVHFYASPSCDSSGAGEGQTLLAVTSAFTSNTGDTEFSTIVGPLAPGTAITATTTNAGNNTSEFSTCVFVEAAAPSADLAVVKTASPDPVVVGNHLTYTITVANSGPDDASNVGVADTLPAGVHFVSATPSQGTCTGTSTVSCSLGTLANGLSATVTIVVTPTAPGTVVNTASTTGTERDPNEANNSATASTTVNSAPLPPFEVSNTNDSGPGSLRQAILNANAIAGNDVITFNIPGSGVHTISPASPLPVINEASVIDGLSQPGCAGLPLIELDGTSAGYNANGLVLAGSGISVRGLAINRFGSGAGASGGGGSGVVVQGAGARIQMNAIGTDPAGTTARANRAHGILCLQCVQRADRRNVPVRQRRVGQRRHRHPSARYRRDRCHDCREPGRRQPSRQRRAGQRRRHRDPQRFVQHRRRRKRSGSERRVRQRRNRYRHRRHACPVEHHQPQHDRNRPGGNRGPSATAGMASTWAKRRPATRSAACRSSAAAAPATSSASTRWPASGSRAAHGTS